MNGSELQDLEAIIGDIVRRDLQEKARAGNSTPSSALSAAPVGRVLVAVCCDDCLNDDSKAAIAELRNARFDVQQPAEEEFKKRASREKWVSSSDIVVMPAVGDDDAAKMALGIFDEPVAR